MTRRLRGSRDRAVFRAFKDIRVEDELTIELVPRIANPTLHQVPVLQGVEIIRQQAADGD